MSARRTLVLAILLPGLALADAVASLVASLASDGSPKVRAQAAISLASYPEDPATAPALVAAIADASPIVRGAVARSLGQVKAAGAFVALATAARDRDAFVAKWAGWGARQVAAWSGSVSIGLRGLAARGGPRQDELTKASQEGVLERLLAEARFDVGSSVDFSDEVAGADVARAGGASVHLELEGEVASVGGDELAATATVSMRAVSASGFVVWTVKGSGSGTGKPPPPPGPDDDEYTIRAPGVDARPLAVADAGRAAGSALLDAMEAEKRSAAR
ncbi:MAG: HEAT repeat domain-containing protein [Deltaproteobacteria bacterium]|nr:HEAT repeat domain-containing protein [Deltaproteobacteria bacterium]